MLRETAAIGLTTVVLAPAVLAQESQATGTRKIHHNTPHHIKLASPASLPNYGDLISNDEFADLEPTAVGVYERPKGSTGSYAPACSGNIVDVSAGPGQPIQKDVLTAEHCFVTDDQNLALTAPAVNISNLEPNEYAVSMPQYPGGFRAITGFVTAISVIINSGDPNAPNPDAALLSIQPTSIPDGDSPYDTAPALSLTPQKRPKPGEQLASFAFPYGAASNTTGAAGVSVYLGRLNVNFTQLNTHKQFHQTVDVSASEVTNALYDPAQYGTSGHLSETASRTTLGPTSGRAGVRGIKNQPTNTDPSPQVNLGERKYYERVLGLNLSRFNVIELSTVLSARNVRQLVQGLGNMAVAKNGPTS